EVDLPLGIRLSLYEDDQDGYGPDYGLKVAEALKNIDYVHFSAGRFAPPGSSSSFYSPKTHIANRLPRKPAIKTIVVGSVTSLEDAERVLKTADFVSVGRALLADPYFPVKIMTAPDTLRPCIRCNQACRDLSYGEVRCTVNPDTGLESVRRPIIRLNGEITVVGGGIKGLECALEAAKSGLRVTLYEASEVVGGQIRNIFDDNKRSEFQRIIGYYFRVLTRMGVDFRLGEKYSGNAVYCFPDKIYPALPEKNDLVIDSNIYQHHDEALRLARSCSVTMTERSLSSLDRVRQESYKRIAEKAGIRFVKSLETKPDVSIIERRQYDIRSAMVSGREAFRKFVENKTQDFL
ncbi:MAG: NAD(P)-binding protein, partial [Thermoplasmataceae archaeon]